ncbi:MAG: hypothetical protein ABIR57_08765, partial [Aeromicrobium sp.]
KLDPNGNPYLLTGYSSAVSTTTQSTFTSAPASSFSIVGTSNKTVTLRWKKVTGATFYRIQQILGTDKRYLNTNVPGSQAGVSTSGDYVYLTLNKFCDTASIATKCTGFTAGKVYTFRVATYGDQDGATVAIADYTASPGLSTAVSALPLATPRNLEKDATTYNSITLSWDAVAGATSYRLQQRKTSSSSSTEARYLYNLCGTDSPVVCTNNSGRISVTLKNWASNNVPVTEALKSNTKYFFKISAALPNGSPGVVTDTYTQFDDRASEYSPSYLTVSTSAYQYSPPPIHNQLSGTSSIRLAWASAASGVYYQLQRSSTSDFSTTISSYCTPIDTLTYRWAGLAKETTYYFRIRVSKSSTCSSGASDFSPPISARTTDGAGSLSGTVSGPSNAISTMRAAAYAYQDGQTSSNVEVAAATRVSSDGSFSLTGLRPGKYRVLLSQIGGTNYVSPWVNNRSTCTTYNAECHKFMVKSTIFTVTTGTLVPIGSTTVGSGVSLDGTVKNSAGSPISTVDVTAIAATMDPSDVDASYREVQDNARSAFDGSGSYSLTGLFPGKYKIAFAKSGYVTYGVWLDPIQSFPGNPSGLNVRICRTGVTCTATPGATVYSNG